MGGVGLQQSGCTKHDLVRVTSGDVGALRSQNWQADGSSVTRWAHTPRIPLLEFTGPSEKVMSHDSVCTAGNTALRKCDYVPQIHKWDLSLTT